MMQTIKADQAGTFNIANDILVYRMGFGALHITGKSSWGPPEDKNKMIKLLHTCLDLGINFIDTADSYGPHISEKLIAEAFYPYPTELLVTTKGGWLRPAPDQWVMCGRPDHLENAIKGSLKRLKMDRIDLYQLHRFDPDVPMDETLGLLKEMQDKEYFLHFGLSEVSVDQIKMASQTMKVVSVQNRYSITNRSWKKELKWCEKNGAAFIPWYPLDSGALKHPALLRLAVKYKTTIYQLALAWSLRHSPNILLIPGTSSVAHLKENVAAGSLELSEEDMAELTNME